MSLEYHGVTIWVILFWLVAGFIFVCLLIFLERKYREDTRDHKRNNNPLSLNEPPDKKDE